MRYNTPTIITVLFAFVFGSIAPAIAAYDAFLKIEGVEGESADKDHGGWIDIESFSWGMNHPASTSGGGGAGKANFMELDLGKHLDKATPLLMLRSAEGRHIPEAHLVLRKQGESGHVFFEIELKNVFVTSVGIQGEAGDTVPSETLSLNYEEIKITYTPQRADGGPEEPVSAGWNVAENRRVDTDS